MAMPPKAELPGSGRALVREDVEPLIKSLHPWLSSETINLLTVGTKEVNGRDTGEVCVVVGVERKKRMSELGPNDFPVPPTVELHIQNPDGSILAVDIPTDVVEVGPIRKLSLHDRVRPVPGGYQISVSAGIFSESGGTLGANVVYNGQFRLITNNHVISNNGNVGSTVYQPEYALWGNSLTTVEGFVPVTTYPTKTQPHPVMNTQDIAWALMNPTDGATNITQIGQPTGIRAPVVGEAVRWIGKKTGTVQNATIASITTSAVLLWGGTTEYAWFQNVVTFNGGVADQGDSGSAVVATADMMIVAQIFATGPPNVPYATRIL
jgi:hypothetical protein